MNQPEEQNATFIPIKQQRLSEEVYRQLKEAILGGHYKPGDRLPSEKVFRESVLIENILDKRSSKHISPHVKGGQAL
jgi:GntR family transcriptional regulator, transcriptional repressor for pyruvate dehydrogenase complex